MSACFGGLDDVEAKKNAAGSPLHSRASPQPSTLVSSLGAALGATAFRFTSSCPARRSGRSRGQKGQRLRQHPSRSCGRRCGRWGGRCGRRRGVLGGMTAVSDLSSCSGATVAVQAVGGVVRGGRRCPEGADQFDVVLELLRGDAGMAPVVMFPLGTTGLPDGVIKMSRYPKQCHQRYCMGLIAAGAGCADVD